MSFLPPAGFTPRRRTWGWREDCRRSAEPAGHDLQELEKRRRRHDSPLACPGPTHVRIEALARKRRRVLDADQRQSQAQRDRHEIMVILLGLTEDDETGQAPDGAPSRSRWVLRYLNTGTSASPRTYTSRAAPAPPVAPTVRPRPSFDCARAVTLLENFDLQLPKLSAADSELAALYARAVESAANKEGLRDQQRIWRRLRDRCTDDACMLAEDEKRSAVLRSHGR